MNKQELIEKIRGGLIVSCQALDWLTQQVV